MEFNRKKQQFVYPHPQIKDLSRQYIDDFRNPPHLYTYYKESNPSIPSSKILRTSYKWPLIGKVNTVVLQPFNYGFQLNEENKIIRCNNCQLIMNPYTQSINICEYQCNICKKLQTRKPGQIEKFLKNSILGLSQSSIQQLPKPNQHFQLLNQKFTQQKIMFVIELNQDSYNFKIHQVLENLIQGMKELLSYKFGFLLYDQKFLYLLSIKEKTLYKIFINQEQISQLPIDSQSLFIQPKKQQMQWVLQSIKQLLYEAFYTKKSDLLYIKKFLKSHFKNKQNIKFQFIINNFQKKQYQQKQQKQNINQHTFQDMLFQFFIITKNKYIKQIMESDLNSQIQKIYEKNKFNKDDLYYDLYHCILRPSYKNVIMYIRTSKSIKINQKKCIFNKITSQTPILVQFQIDKKLFQEAKQIQIIQFQIIYKKNKRLVISYPVNQAIQIKSNRNQQLHSVVNDQILFYVIVRKIIDSINSIKKPTFQLIKRIKSIINTQGEYSISRNLKHLFLYSFLIINSSFLAINSETYLYQRHRFFNMTLQQFVKTLYLRIYTVQPIFQNIKSIQSKIDSHQLYLADDGRYIYIVIGYDYPVQKLKSNFGNWNVKQIVHLRDIPTLETNQQLVKAIQFIRQRNQHCFLPLKIMQLDSPQFSSIIGQRLYVAQDHRKFLQILFQKRSPKKPLRY